jgi:uncharacterized protein with HEPN domain
MWRDDARLMDILLTCREAEGYVRGLTREQFRQDTRTQRALCMTLEIIGEAARAVSQECQAANPEIPWRGIIGLRNRIIHEYFRLDLDMIWEIAHKDVPALMALVAPLIPPDLGTEPGEQRSE